MASKFCLYPSDSRDYETHIIWRHGHSRVRINWFGKIHAVFTFTRNLRLSLHYNYTTLHCTALPTTITTTIPHLTQSPHRTSPVHHRS